MSEETTRIGSRGTIVIPAQLRKRYGLRAGSLIIAEPRDDGILLRPAIAIPVEVYTPERKAEFILSTATDDEDYLSAVDKVREMGLDPEAIPHRKPRR